MKITPAEIKRQYTRVKTAGWIPWFQEAAEMAGTTTAHFLAIGSRESNLINVKGDFRDGRHHGFGVMQVDVGTDPDFAKNWSPDNPKPGIRRGGEIYASKVEQVLNGQGESLSVRGRKFVGKETEDDDVRRIATAGYNSGLWGYYHFSNGDHIDSTTTGKDYSRDVYDRSIEFADLLDKDGTEPGALKREVQLQGKYARAVHQKRAGVDETPDVEEPEEPPTKPEPEVKPVTKPASPPSVETENTNPPVIKVQPRDTSIITKIAAAASAAAPVVAATGLKIGGVEFKTGGVVAIAAVIIVGMLIAAWIWNESQKRRHEELKLSMENLADRQKLNVISGDAA